MIDGYGPFIWCKFTDKITYIFIFINRTWTIRVKNMNKKNYYVTLGSYSSTNNTNYFKDKACSCYMDWSINLDFENGNFCFIVVCEIKQCISKKKEFCWVHSNRIVLIKRLFVFNTLASLAIYIICFYCINYTS